MDNLEVGSVSFPIMDLLRNRLDRLGSNLLLLWKIPDFTLGWFLLSVVETLIPEMPLGMIIFLLFLITLHR